MNLTTFKNILKKSWPFFLFAVFVGFIIAIVYAKYNSSQPLPPISPKIEQNPSLKQPQIVDTSKLGKVDIPNTLPIYDAEKSTLTQDLAQRIAGELSIKGEAVMVDKNTTDGTQYTWEENGKILSVSETAVTYKNGGGIAPPSEDLPEDILVKQTADTLNSYKFIGGNLGLDSHKTSYLVLDNDRYKSTNSYQAAQYLKLSFDVGLSGYPVYTNSTSPSLVTAIVRKDGMMTNLVSRYFSSFRSGNNYKLKSLDEALAEIKNGQGNIISTYTLDQNNQAVELYSVAPADVKNADITSVKIAYFLPKNLSESLQPIFVFTGVFKNINQNGKILIYLPALKTPDNNSGSPKP